MKSRWTTVFRFTFRHAVCSKGYLALTLIVTLLLLIAIPTIMVLADAPDAPTSDTAARITTLYTVDLSEDDLPSLAGTPYEEIEIVPCKTLAEARSQAENTEHSALVFLEEKTYTVLYAGGMGVRESDTQALADCLSYARTASETGGELPAVAASSLAEASDPEAGEGGVDLVREIAGYLVPYLTVLVLYFLILFHAQSVANSVIMEKTSKLMDLFLVGVKPSRMILGKTLAIAAAGLLQALLFLFGAVGGLKLGAALVRASNPDTTMGVILWMETIGGFASAFDPMVLLTAALVLVTGFLLYCSLSAIGGALAGKPEDLSATNYLFTLALVASFLVCLFTGEGGGQISQAPILNYIPFTAALVLPARLLMGTVSVAQGLLGASLTAVCAVALMLLSGKLYSMMAFYRGKPMNPIQLLSSLRKRG